MATVLNEEEWRIGSESLDLVDHRRIYDGDKLVGIARTKEYAAQIVADHKAAKSQALLVEALRAIIEREGREQCEIYHAGLGSCLAHGRRNNSQLKAEQCCASCIADVALKAI